MRNVHRLGKKKKSTFRHKASSFPGLINRLLPRCKAVAFLEKVFKQGIWLYTKIGVLLHFYSVFRIIHEKVRVSELQYSIFLRSYLKIRERKKLERKKVRAQPLCHLNNPPTNPFELLDISMLLYHKETGHLDGEAKLV